MMSYHVEDLNQDNAADWEELNQRSDDGSIYHTLRWKEVLERSFSIKNHYFIIYKNDEPVALCPFFEEPLRGFRSLVPPPSTDLSHIIVNDPYNQLIIKEILLKSIDVAKKNRFAYVIMAFSNIDAINSIQAVSPVGHKKTVPFAINGYLSLNLEEYSPAYIWERVFNRKGSQRTFIRRFEQSGYKFRDTKEKTDIDDFYKYYTMNLKHIGAVPFHRSHFDVIFDAIPDDELRLTLLENEGEIAGGLLALNYPQKKRMYLRYMAINRNISNTYHPAYALYWDAINYGFKNGYKEICFGTNTNDPKDKSLRIKKEFGCRYISNYGMLLPMKQIYGMLYWASRFLKGRASNLPVVN